MGTSLWEGLLRAGTSAAIGKGKGDLAARERQREDEEREREARRALLQDRLLNAQIGKLENPGPEPEAAHYDPERGIVIFTTPSGKVRVEKAAEPKAPKVETPAPFTLGPGQQRFGADGQPIAAVPAAPPKPRAQSATVAQAIAKNKAQAETIRQAMTELAKNPKSVGMIGYAPDALAQRLDPKGVAARALIANAGSLKIHDRSGGAVSASEFPRLAPFIPSAKDSPQAARQKLALLLREIEAFNAELEASGDTVEDALAEAGAVASPTAPPPLLQRPEVPVAGPDYSKFLNRR